MAVGRLAVVLILSLVADAFSIPAVRWRRDSIDNEVDKDSVTSSSEVSLTRDEKGKSHASPSPEVVKDIFGTAASNNSPQIADSSNDKPQPVDSFEDDDDFSDEPKMTPSGGGGGGSNIFSLLKLAGALFPSSSGNNIISRKTIQDFVIRNQATLLKLGHNIGDYLRKSQDYKQYPTHIKVGIRRAEPKQTIYLDQFLGENQVALRQVQNDFTKLLNNRMQRREDVADNMIYIDYTVDLKPPSIYNHSTFQRQEIDEVSETDEDDSSEDNRQTSESESSESGTEELGDNGDPAEKSVEDNKTGSKEDYNPKGDGDNDANSNGDEKDNDDAAEESVEDNTSKSKEDSDPKGDGDNDVNSNEDSDYDSDQPPEGNGGGILGLLAGLSGGEDGQSDLGSLLATVSGIVAQLSGDGIDINALIGSGIGLFVGLLSQDNENAGEVLAGYSLTSLDTLTGGGAKNNGEFFGKYLSKLIKGTSAAGDPAGSSEENGEGNGGMKMADSASFFLSFLTGILGDMSKGSSGGGSW